MNFEPTVFIIDDDPAIRSSLQWLLDSVNIKNLAFSSAEDFLKHYSIYMVGCIILDIRMSGMSGLQLQQKLNEQPHPIPIIFITGHGDVPLAVRAMKQGAIHFMEKPFDDQELLETINVAIAKDKENRKQRIDIITLQARHSNLTDREAQVFDLVVQKMANKDIAEKLNIKIKTVEFHRSHVMEKMYAETLHDLLEMARLLKSIPK